MPDPVLSSRTCRVAGAADAAGELMAGDDEVDEPVEMPANRAHKGMRNIKAMIPAQPISPLRQKCPFFLISYPDGICCGNACTAGIARGATGGACSWADSGKGCGAGAAGVCIGTQRW